MWYKNQLSGAVGEGSGEGESLPGESNSGQGSRGVFCRKMSVPVLGAPTLISSPVAAQNPNGKNPSCQGFKGGDNFRVRRQKKIILPSP